MIEKAEVQKLNPECFGSGQHNVAGCRCKMIFERLISETKV